MDFVSEYAIFRLGETGIATTWNRGAQHLKGYEASEVIGRHFLLFYPRGQAAAGHPEKGAKRSRRGRILGGRMVRPQGGSLLRASGTRVGACPAPEGLTP